MEEPFDVTLEDVSYLLCGTAHSQQTGTYSPGAAPGKPLYVLQYAAVFQRLYSQQCCIMKQSTFASSLQTFRLKIHAKSVQDGQNCHTQRRSENGRYSLFPQVYVDLVKIVVFQSFSELLLQFEYFSNSYLSHAL